MREDYDQIWGDFSHRNPGNEQMNGFQRQKNKDYILIGKDCYQKCENYLLMVAA